MEFSTALAAAAGKRSADRRLTARSAARSEA